VKIPDALIVRVVPAAGGLGDRSTVSISKIGLSGLAQNSRGLSPGTGNVSSRECWLLPPLNSDNERADALAVRRAVAALRMLETLILL